MRVALVLALVLAGCVAPAASVEPTGVSLAGAPASSLVRWHGANLTGHHASSDAAPFASCMAGISCDEPTEPCDATDCLRTSFDVVGAPARVVASARWPTDTRVHMTLRIVDAANATVVAAPVGYVDAQGVVAVLDHPFAGTYAVEVLALSGTSGFEGALRVEERDAATDGPARDVLPDLVTLPPTDLRIEAPPPLQVNVFTLGPAHIDPTAPGCTAGESAEHQPTRCLRFSNAVGNVGEGALDIRLDVGGARWTQIVHRSDGTTRDSPAGPAEWHALHAHWHNGASERYVLYRYDAATATRGDAMGEGRKAGICFADVGLVELGSAVASLPRYAGYGCIDPHHEGAWTMGLDPGWYDLYYWPIADQYVDLGHAPDGTYTLCSLTNEDGLLQETTLDNNAACTPFQLTGDAITLLSPAPYHAEPPGADPYGGNREAPRGAWRSR